MPKTLLSVSSPLSSCSGVCDYVRNILLFILIQEGEPEKAEVTLGVCVCECVCVCVTVRMLQNDEVG